MATLLASSAALPARQLTSVALWDNVEPEIKAEVSAVKKDDNESQNNSHEATTTTKAEPTTKPDSKSDSDNNSDSNNSDSDVKSDDNKDSNKSDSNNEDSKSDDSNKSDAKETSESPTPAGTRIFANNTATISINPNLPAGSIILNVPTSTAKTYIKAGDYATFEWSFTNLIVSPTAVNIEAYCSANMQTYTIATNQSIDDTQAIWNTSDVLATADVGLMTAQYTLYIYDSNATATSISEAGFLTPLTYIFGVYLPQKYQPWAQSVNYINLGAILSPPGIMTSVFSILSLLVIGLMV